MLSSRATFLEISLKMNSARCTDRVSRNGGDIVLFPGNGDLANEIHEFLIRRGFRWAKFQEPEVDYVR